MPMPPTFPAARQLRAPLAARSTRCISSADCGAGQQPLALRLAFILIRSSCSSVASAFLISSVLPHRLQSAFSIRRHRSGPDTPGSFRSLRCRGSSGRCSGGRFHVIENAVEVGFCSASKNSEASEYLIAAPAAAVPARPECIYRGFAAPYNRSKRHG